MTDENPPTSSSVDDSTEQLSPCADANENPEDHIGDVTADPWDDDAQTDWPSNGGATA